MVPACPSEVPVTRSSRWLALVAGFATIIAPSLLAPTEALAQRRAVRRPPARSVVYVPVRSYRPVYYAPYYSLGLYGGWYSGWYGWYPYSFYGRPYPYPYAYRYYDDYRSSARLQVRPKQAEVFIDGYFVGQVDDFDGWAQRLHVEPGEHELAIYLEGHRTYRQNVLFRPGATLRVEHVLQPLAPGDPAEPRPTPSAAPAQPRRPDPYERPAVRRGQPPPARPAPSQPGESAEYGAIAVRVQPADAEVVVDGERWESPDAGDLTLQLSEGTHRVEVRKDGFRTYTAEIRVRRGETTSLNVSLTRQ
jgi:hypothetical protein